MYATYGIKRALQVNQNGIATIFGDRTRTWKEVYERVTRFAGGLRDRGINNGERVAILALNSDRYFEYFFSVPWAGGVVVPLNIRLAPAELIYLLNDSEATILVIDDAFKSMLPELLPELTSVKTIIYADDQEPPENSEHYEDIITQSSPVEDAEHASEDIYGLFYTGGTTGLPKGVMLTHNNIFVHSLTVPSTFNYSQNTVYLHAGPMFHLADGASTFAMTNLGGVHVFIPRFDPVLVLEAFEQHKVSNCLLVPTMINMLNNHPDVQNYNTDSLVRIIYGASPMPEAVAFKAMELFPNVNFTQAYGMTETSPMLAFLPPECHQPGNPLFSKMRSAGQSVPGVTIKIADADDNEIERNQVGHILVSGPGIMKGYWKQPKVTEETLRGGWMHTGDMGYMDDDGFIYLVDRAKDMIISGGENIYSAETESAIYALDGIAECAVIGVPSKQWGETVHAVIVVKPDYTLTEEQVIEHCKTLIAGYKCPRSVTVRAEPLPISGAGKILKNKLREPYWEGYKKQVN